MKDRITCADVKPIREAMGYSVRELAEEIDATPAAVHSWEAENPDSTRSIHPVFANQLKKLKRKYVT